MANGGDQGFFMGMMAARRARERRSSQNQAGRNSGGGVLFNIFPTMVIPMVIYAVVAFIGGVDAMVAPLFQIPMVSGGNWALTTGDSLSVCSSSLSKWSKRPGPGLRRLSIMDCPCWFS